MPKYDRDKALLVHKDGLREEIMPGETVTSRRGEKWTFMFVSKLPGGGSNGKIIVSKRPGDPFAGQEYYPSVFDAEIEILAEKNAAEDRTPKLILNAGEIRDIWTHLKRGEEYPMRLTNGELIWVAAGDPQEKKLGVEHADLDEIEVRGASL